MFSLVVTIDSARVVLRNARKFTPFHDPVKYCMTEWSREEDLKWVVEFLQSASTGLPLRGLLHGDCYALPPKVLHGPIGNARPLLNFTTMWKLVGVHIASQYVPLLARAWILPCTQLALHASSTIVDLLHVPHDYVSFRLLRRKRVCLVVDDIRHAYGCVVHDTLRCFFTNGRFSGGSHKFATTGHHGGHSSHGWIPWGHRGACALTGRRGARMPGVSAGVLCGGRSARVLSFECLRVGDPPGLSTGYSIWMTPRGAYIRSQATLRLFADNSQRAGLKTNLFSSAPN